MGEGFIFFRAMLVLPGLLAPLPLEEVIALRGVRIIGRRGKLLHWNEKSRGKKRSNCSSFRLPALLLEGNIFVLKPGA